ncbi:MAG: hypothetical protein B1H11_05300 [Desulfobacteraceae bacterium 4484_190.1]|nr:MAG: hypothetical protein B1H11_05300 [Desulfobacteraceae bacterium 4484_190.1]
MKTVNALKIRNNLGEVLDMLARTSEPVFVSKGREIKAVLIYPGTIQKKVFGLSGGGTGKTTA